jgi:hypothetical protein
MGDIEPGNRALSGDLTNSRHDYVSLTVRARRIASTRGSNSCSDSGFCGRRAAKKRRIYTSWIAIWQIKSASFVWRGLFADVNYSK